ncbi:MAG: hypothetical protein NC548_22960 [Lachnospiraceae bacterium]|nr:hypothetical protein [Lachnospiraceae bacterium]
MRNVAVRIFSLYGLHKKFAQTLVILTIAFNPEICYNIITVKQRALRAALERGYIMYRKVNENAMNFYRLIEGKKAIIAWIDLNIVYVIWTTTESWKADGSYNVVMFDCGVPYCTDSDDDEDPEDTFKNYIETCLQDGADDGRPVEMMMEG